MSTEITIVEQKQQEIAGQLKNGKVASALLATTFKGLSVENMQKALLEGMLRGFTFQDFLKKDVYAVPFAQGYSIVTSIDFARKIASRTGQLFGKSAPLYEVGEDGTIISCTITMRKLVSGQIGEFTATVYFSEYSTGKNLWVSKPRTMIAKVAEMHALRMAFPEEMAKTYVEEEFEKTSRISAVVEHPDGPEIQMGSHVKTKDKGTVGEGVDEAPDAETIIQIEEATNNEKGSGDK